MKINPLGGAGFISGNYKMNKAAAYTKTPHTASGDELSISEEALSFSKIFSEAKAAASERADSATRVADIKERIAAGTYNVDSADVADSILENLYI